MIRPPTQTSPAVAQEVAAFIAEYGRPPSQAEMWSIRQEIAYATRKPKRKDLDAGHTVIA